MHHNIHLTLCALLISSCSFANETVEILDEQALTLIDVHAELQIVGEGFAWTEGPLWIEEGGYLLFSDIPNNVIHKYDRDSGMSVYLEKAGATGLVDGDYMQGSNGLLLNSQNELVLMQQGDRRIAVMDAPLSAPKGRYRTLTSHFDGQRLNSPNDGVYHSDGSLYFTDPPYGLTGTFEDERKELPFQGVYRLDVTGELFLLDDSVSAPNGIGITVDEKILLVAVSDDERPLWLAYDIANDGAVENRRVFYDATEVAKLEAGKPDGMAVHSSGLIFATGPGGVWLFTPEGEVLAKIKTGKLTANCALSADEKMLFLTAHDTLMTFPLK